MPGFSAGNYATITDDTGCTNTASITLSNPSDEVSCVVAHLLLVIKIMDQLLPLLQKC
ncbi:MAG: hypothetical protein U0T36_06470 [Saprospiraceae bacterium]